MIRPLQKETPRVDLARLIPGEAPAFREARKKKPVQSINAFAVTRSSISTLENSEISAESGLGFIIPSPLRSRIALRWLRSMLVDWALIAFSWLLVGALLVRLHLLYPHVRFFGYEPVAAVPLLGIAVLHAALITLVGYTEGVHSNDLDLTEQSRMLGKSILLATTVLCFAYCLQGVPCTTTIAWFCAAGLLEFAALWLWRWWSQEINQASQEAGSSRNVLIVGAGPVGRRVAAHIANRPTGCRVVCGFLDDARPLGDQIIGRPSDLARITRERFIDELILAAPQNNDMTRRVLHEARRLKVDVEIVPDLCGCRPVGNEIERFGEVPVICLHAEQLPAAALVLKRMVDIAGAALALALLSPLLAMIAFLIKLDSPGPVLYGAQRAGRKRQFFRCYKFRTMVANADALKERLRQNNERSGPFFKIASDPRITRLGRYLRRYSLDELPQLWNVLKGEMSLVGPRPHPVDDVAGYEIGDLARLDVTPGITGLWQVTARRDPSFHRGIELDREYIRTWSLALDMKILMRTFVAVVCGSGD